MTIRFFLDTEWADVLGADLVSIGLISEDGVHRFYAERNPLPAVATDFVRVAVYPLLQGGSASMSDMAMTTGLRAFLGADTAPFVLADNHHDLALLRYVLAGFDLPDDQAQACGPPPQPVMTVMPKKGLTGQLVEDWFQAHPEQSARRHHALVDDQALRMAWLVATRRIEPPEWATSVQRLGFQ